MRSVNFAQPFANAVASVRDCASVVGNATRKFLLHLLRAHLGTTVQPQGHERPQMNQVIYGAMAYMWQPAMLPATCSITHKSTSKRGS